MIRAAPGTLISVATFQGFTINGMTDTGTIKTYVDSSSTMGMRVYKIVSDETLIALNGNSKTFTGTHWWKQMQGGTTTMPDDDVYQVTGTLQQAPKHLMALHNLHTRQLSATQILLSNGATVTTECKEALM